MQHRVQFPWVKLPLAGVQETAPLNLDGLQSLCSALTTAAMQENEDPLSVSDYLKVCAM